jgi:hypothetical protein
MQRMMTRAWDLDSPRGIFMGNIIGRNLVVGKREKLTNDDQLRMRLLQLKLEKIITEVSDWSM